MIRTSHVMGIAALIVLAVVWSGAAHGQGADGFSVYYVTPDGTGGGGDGPTTDTLQKAIDIVDDDADVIKVQAGTYTDTTPYSTSENAAIVGRTMTILGGYAPGDWVNRDPGANQTILDPDYKGAAVYVTAGNLVIDGFRLMNGKGVTVSVGGGSLDMRHCTVTGTLKNPSGTGTGAVQASYRTVTLTSCSIVNNGTGSEGISNVAGVYLYYGALTVTSCTISGNYNHGIMLNTVHGARVAGCAILSNAGTGVRFDYGDNCTVTSNTIQDNDAYGVYANRANGLQMVGNRYLWNFNNGMFIKDCDGFAANDNYVYLNGRDAIEGGGLYVESCNGATVLRNDFVRNEAGIGGGGVYIDKYTAHFLVEDNFFIRNESGIDGGGLVAEDTNGTIRNNRFCGNYADQACGGMKVTGDEPIVVTGNVFFLNEAVDSGGGMLVANENAVVTSNTCVSNTGKWGGGATLSGSRMWVEGNFAHDNQATFDGGGMLIGGGDMLLLNNTIWRNRCWLESGTPPVGGGMSMAHSQATLINNVIAGNRHGAGENWTGTGGGSGIYMERSAPQLYFNTVVNNQGGDGSGIYAREYLDEISTLTMYGNIVTSHTIGVRVRDTSIANLDYTLWGGGDWVNGTNTEIITSGTITDLNPLTGAPLFVNPAVCDYHIAGGSGGENAVPMLVLTSLWSSASLSLDCDAQGRPYGGNADAGADEIAAALPEVNFVGSATTQSESVGTYMLPVSLSAPSALPVTVNYLVEAATSDLSFYDDTWTFPGIVTFSTGTTTAYIPVRVLDDDMGEGPEHFTISLVNPRNAHIGASRTFTYSILESDGGIVLWLNTLLNHLVEFNKLEGNDYIYADINKDGRIDAADRTKRLLDILGATAIRGDRNGYSATLAIGDDSAAAGEVVEIPITLTGDTDLSAVHMRLTYDPAVLEWDTGITSYIEFGPMITATHGWTYTQPGTGQLDFWFGDNGSTVTAFASGQTLLCTLRMRIAAAATAGTTDITIRPDDTRYPVDAGAGVADMFGNSIALTRLGGTVTVTGAAASTAFSDTQTCSITSDGHFYALAWNYGTNSSLGNVDTYYSADMDYTMTKGDWLGFYIYDYNSGQWVRGLTIYSEDL